MSAGQSKHAYKKAETMTRFKFYDFCDFPHFPPSTIEKPICIVINIEPSFSKHGGGLFIFSIPNEQMKSFQLEHSIYTKNEGGIAIWSKRTMESLLEMHTILLKYDICFYFERFGINIYFLLITFLLSESPHNLEEVKTKVIDNFFRRRSTLIEPTWVGDLEKVILPLVENHYIYLNFPESDDDDVVLA